MTGCVGPIETGSLENEYFRRVVFTGRHMQLVVMHLEPGEDIGREKHADVDQFFRIERGIGEVVFNDTEHHPVKHGDAIVVPAGTWHNLIDTSSTSPLKLYTLYAPPNHPAGTMHRTRSEAEAGEDFAR